MKADLPWSYGGDLHALCITICQMLYYSEMVVVEEDISLVHKRGFEISDSDDDDGGSLRNQMNQIKQIYP